MSKWETTKALDISSMFEECQSLTSLDLSSFETNVCRKFDNMFKSCNENLTVLVDKAKSQNMINAIKDTVNVVNA